MTTVIKGQPTSAEVRQALKAEGRPVVLACSLGKDSLAAWIALERDGIEVVPVYFWSIPRLPMVEESIAKIEAVFGVRIHQYPHPRWFRTLNNCVYQSPDHCGIIDAAGLVEMTYEDERPLILEDLGLPPDTWECDGVRACDNPYRRASLTRHGLMKKTTRKASVIADWTKKECMDAIAERGIGLPPDYELFGRSFDGLDMRFMKPLRENRPEDFEIVRKWYPFIKADELRWEHYGL
ncbi:phosphoadenosine phosphosulfate reductase [Slackia faecicanis]|uniref:phosphoadenosine phosphosulfate reductase n=1 Tax=Slackia faecicanis TaxID=255723 RepID=UPI0011CEC2B5|nr:phosphoadenosine phosphosulfate reductase [Slackia faecicanis]